MTLGGQISSAKGPRGQREEPAKGRESWRPVVRLKRCRVDNLRLRRRAVWPRSRPCDEMKGQRWDIFTCPSSRRASPLMLEKRPRPQRGVRGCAGGASCVLVLPSRHASPIRRCVCGPRQHAQPRRALDLRDLRLRAARRCGRVGLRRLNRGSCPSCLVPAFDGADRV